MDIGGRRWQLFSYWCTTDSTVSVPREVTELYGANMKLQFSKPTEPPGTAQTHVQGNTGNPVCSQIHQQLPRRRYRQSRFSMNSAHNLETAEQTERWATWDYREMDLRNGACFRARLSIVNPSMYVASFLAGGDVLLRSM